MAMNHDYDNLDAEDHLQDVLDNCFDGPAVTMWMNLSTVQDVELGRMGEFARMLLAATREEQRQRTHRPAPEHHSICPVCFEAVELDEITRYMITGPRLEDLPALTGFDWEDWRCPQCDESSETTKWVWDQRRAAEYQAALWNANVPAGHPVDYYSSPNAQPELHEVLGVSTILEGHTACVNLKDKSGVVSVASCVPHGKAAWIKNWMNLGKVGYPL
jgi:hypothetical protein